jgi:8-oxo-dGTP diphosphatase
MSKADQHIDEKRYLITPRTLVFLFDDQNRVLLLKGAKNKTRWAGLFNGIGGHVERGEDIYEAAYRELREEAGIFEVNLNFCAQITVDVSDNLGVMIFVFKGEYLNENFTNSGEGTLSWVNLNAIDSLPVVEDLPTLIPRIAAYKPLFPVIIGMYTYDEHGNLISSFHEERS